jgi:hypothetical protein
VIREVTCCIILQMHRRKHRQIGRIPVRTLGDGLMPPAFAVSQKEGQKHETKGNIQEKAGNLLHNDKLKAKGATACSPLRRQLWSIPDACLKMKHWKP